ncbi:MAG: tRNA epoxyqueuosine(34) reductase QueG [Spirochaetales bacterium]
MSDDVVSASDTELLGALLLAQGLVLLGVAGVEADTSAHAATYSERLSGGSFGTMAYLERHRALKYAPSLVVPGTRSLVIAGLSYFQPKPDRPHSANATGQVARYAWGRDYHKVLLNKLQAVAADLQARFPGETFRSFTDTSPIDERFWAQVAGGAFTARNTLSIHQELGSWFVLGEIFSSQQFVPSGRRPHVHGSCPSACRRCVEVCPTGALDGKGGIDARKCLAYLTIEHRGPIALEFREALGDRLFGCDLCQEVCPFNLKASPTIEAQFLAWKAGSELDLREILELKDEKQFTLRFGGSPVHRAGFQGLRRNACLVAGNLGAKSLEPVLARLAAEDDPVVAEAAEWALARWRLS